MLNIRPARLGVLLALIATSCAPSMRLGPEQSLVTTPAELAQRIATRVEGVQAFYEVGATARAGLIPAPTDIFISNELGFRLQVRNPITGADLASLIVNNEDGEFIAIDNRKKKAVTGEMELVLSKYLPKLGLASEELAPMKLFFPTFEIRTGLKSAMLMEGDAYVAEFWDPATGPKMQVRVNAWTLVPTALKLFHEGDALVEFEWADFTWRPEEDLVIARSVKVGLPQRDKTITLTTKDPRINKTIQPTAFRLRIPAGFDVEEIGAEDEQD